MRVNKRIKTPEGITHIDCEFTEEEADVIFGIGLTEMLRVGAIPFTLLNVMDSSKIAPGGNA